MYYRGHFKNGIVVLDEPVELPEGAEVLVEPVKPENKKKSCFALRGTPYRFDDPFTPAAPAEEWNAYR